MCKKIYSTLDNQKQHDNGKYLQHNNNNKSLSVHNTMSPPTPLSITVLVRKLVRKHLAAATSSGSSQCVVERRLTIINMLA